MLSGLPVQVTMGILRNRGERPFQPVPLSKDLLHTGTFAGYYCTVLSAGVLYYCSVEGAPEPMDTSEPVVLLRINSRKISNTSRHSYIEAVGMWEGGGPLVSSPDSTLSRGETVW